MTALSPTASWIDAETTGKDSSVAAGRGREQEGVVADFDGIGDAVVADEADLTVADRAARRKHRRTAAERVIRAGDRAERIGRCG